jgi:hypothetical protein
VIPVGVRDEYEVTGPDMLSDDCVVRARTAQQKIAKRRPGKEGVDQKRLFAGAQLKAPDPEPAESQAVL